MLHRRSWALLGAFSVLTVAGQLPRGVGPEFASHYQGSSEFGCIGDPSIKLDRGRINDNSCDCADGSDEPGTAACAFIDALSPEQPLPGTPSGSTNATRALPGFWCKNEGHVGAYVPFEYVNDGVCDYDVCCDGSEEFGGRVVCENRCAVIGREHRKLEEQKRLGRERALKKRTVMVVEASQLRRRAESRLAQLAGEIKTAEAHRDETKRKLAEAELADKNRVVGGGIGGKLGVLVDLARKRVDELRTTLDAVRQHRTTLQGQVNELQTILSTLKAEYNPNFNDEGVKAAVKAFEDFAARDGATTPELASDDEVKELVKEDGVDGGINWGEFEQQTEDTDILLSLEAYLPESLRKAIRGRMLDLRLWLVRNGIVAEKVSTGSESRLVKTAREAADTAEREVQDKIKEQEDQRTDLEKDYGPSDVLRALRGRSISIDSGEYTYELNWLGQTFQKSKKGHGDTNMGEFSRIDKEMADEEERLDGKSLGKGIRMVLRYEDGLGCWNGPRRRTDVWLGCAETEELWRVTEAEKCVYKMEVGTPAACEGEGEEGEGKKKKKKEKDEL